MKRQDRDVEILKHIIKYCDEIDETVAQFGDSYERFCGSHAYRNACAMCLLQIGELCNALSVNFRKAYDEIPWNQIRGLRNVVAHAYGEISFQTTWDTIRLDVPVLRKFCEGIIGAGT